MRVDENTKEVLKTWPLTTVRRWAASPNSFTLVGGSEGGKRVRGRGGGENTCNAGGISDESGFPTPH